MNASNLKVRGSSVTIDRDDFQHILDVYLQSVDRDISMVWAAVDQHTKSGADTSGLHSVLNQFYSQKRQAEAMQALL